MYIVANVFNLTLKVGNTTMWLHYVRLLFAQEGVICEATHELLGTAVEWSGFGPFGEVDGWNDTTSAWDSGVPGKRI
jgi:hypothetical protein